MRPWNQGNKGVRHVSWYLFRQLDGDIVLHEPRINPTGDQTDDDGGNHTFTSQPTRVDKPGQVTHVLHQHFAGGVSNWRGGLQYDQKTD